MADTRYDKAIADDIQMLADSVGGGDSRIGLMLLELLDHYETEPGGPRHSAKDEAGEIVRELQEILDAPTFLSDETRTRIKRARAFITTQRGVEATEDLAERVAEGLWDAYMASPIHKPEYEGVTWPMVREGAKERPLIADLYETGLQEARAAIRIVHQKKEL